MAEMSSGVRHGAGEDQPTDQESVKNESAKFRSKECLSTSDGDEQDESFMSSISVASDDEEGLNQNVEKKQKLTLNCDWSGCKKVFHKRRHLEDHYRSHTGERPFTCEYQGCYKAYTKKEHLKRHQKSHNPGTPRFSCPRCSQTYSLKANLTRHINRTHDEARFQCTIGDCNMSFKKNFQLKTHLSKMHGVKPFVCTHEDCKKEFAQKSHFNRHVKSHKGYDCKVERCDVHLDTWSLMREHVAVSHSQDHTCPTCGKSFPTAQYRAHVKQHKKQRESFLCSYPECHKAYFDKKNLNIHIKVFHEQAKFVCAQEGCQAKLVSKQKLQEHMTKIHDPAYVRKQKLKQKKRRKHRMEKERKEKAVNEVMSILLHKTELKFCATSRREFEGREVGVPEDEVELQVINAPGRPNLMDIVATNKDTEHSNDSFEGKAESIETSKSSGSGLPFSEKSSGLGMSFSESDCDSNSDELDSDSDFSEFEMSPTA